tara:strand:- start:950 stop:1639 length:690 start_codon:yes stop_codon:yes gene_type:complete
MRKNEVVNYVKSRNKSLPEYKFGSLQVIVKDPLPDNIDVDNIFKEITSILPPRFVSLVDVVYVGSFDFFEEREINSLYMDGAIYVSNEQDNNEDMKDDVIHELGHALEDNYHDFIYDDEKIQDEYFAKLIKLKKFLEHEGYNTEAYSFFNLEYDADFDEFLFKKVGYEKLQNLSNGMFLNPYSITSLREYWSTGFEEYFLGNRLYLEKVCPYINRKLSLLELEEVQYGY